MSPLLKVSGATERALESENLFDSKIYIGHLMHQRLWPKKHEFVYPVFSFGIFLDELESLSQSIKLFSYNSKNVLSIYDSDYLARNESSLEEKAKSYVSCPEMLSKISRVFLVTTPRYFNYVFNPVSFYYYFDSSGRALAFLAEVNNTFGEKHTYFLEPESKDPRGNYLASADKSFHVSPFNEVLGKYLFSFSDVIDNLSIRIDIEGEDKEASEKLSEEVSNRRVYFKSGISGKPQSLTSSSLLKTLMKYPFSALLNMPRILMQAAKLYFQKKLTVYTKPLPNSVNTIQIKAPMLSRPKIYLFEKYLSKLSTGSLEIRYPDGQVKRFGDLGSNKKANLFLKDWKFFDLVFFRGDIGFGESYTKGYFDSDSLVQVLEILALNDEVASGNIVSSAIAKLADYIQHHLKKNSIKNSQSNISAHYDLSNDFFELFLDESLTYSSAIYKNPDDSLALAQQNKLRSMLEKAKIKAGDHILEIGCGWGSLATVAARDFGAKVTGITLSKEQKQFAEERIVKLGLSDLIDIQLIDYRKVVGKFDAIVSIEMLEAVGHQYFPDYFEALDRLLKPGGKAVVQTITIPQERYSRYIKSCDWIQKYIFPGGELTCIEHLKKVIAESTSLQMESTQEIGLGYARTLNDWGSAFEEKLPEVKQLGFDEEFIRTWRYYLAYCEGAFLAKAIDTSQIVFSHKS